MIHIVSYTISPKREMSPLIEELKQSSSWWHYLDDTWLVSTDETAQQLWNRLAKKFRTSDHVIVIEITKNHTRQGWLPKEAWEWIRNQEWNMR